MPGCGCVQGLVDNGICDEAKKSAYLSFALTLQSASHLMLNPLSTAFAGHLGKVELAAVVLSNILINIFGNIMAWGMSTACDTYFAQAYGNKQMTYLGVLLQRGLVIHFLLFLFILPVLCNMESLLLVMSQDAQISKLVGKYLITIIPGLLCLFEYTVLEKFLYCQNIVVPGILTGFFGLAVSALFNYVFLYQLNMGITGSAWALNASYLSVLICLLSYTFVSKVCKKTWAGWSWVMLENWFAFTKLGVYGIFMMGLEWWAFETTVPLAGLLGTVQLAAQGVYLNVDAIYLSIGVGLGNANSIRVGQALGEGNPDLAKRIAKIGYVLAFMISSVFSVTILLARFQLPKIFTNVTEVLHVTSSLLPFLSYYIFFDYICFIGRGIAYGSGKQGLATAMIIVVYYCVGLPIGIPLTFLTSLGLYGIWIGISIAVTLAAFSFVIYTLCFFDWKTSAQEAAERVCRLKASDTKEEITETTGLLGNPKALIKKRLLAFLLILLVAVTGVLLRIFLPPPPLSLTPLVPGNTTDLNITFLSHNETELLSTGKWN